MNDRECFACEGLAYLDDGDKVTVFLLFMHDTCCGVYSSESKALKAVPRFKADPEDIFHISKADVDWQGMTHPAHTFKRREYGDLCDELRIKR